jgi:hypothetical protein
VKTELVYDAEADAWEIRHEGVNIESAADVAEWQRQVEAAFHAQVVPARKVFVLVNMAGFKLNPTMGSEYGKVAKSLQERFIAGMVRFGSPGVVTETAVLLQGVLNRYPPNVFPDRATALLALKKLRGLPS